MGCFVFLININDSPKIIEEPCTLFADEISILALCPNFCDLNEKLNMITGKTINWVHDHHLKMCFF